MKQNYQSVMPSHVRDIQLINLHAPYMESTDQRRRCELEYIKHHLERLFSTTTVPDLEPSDLASHGVSTISYLSYSSYAAATYQRTVECVLNGKDYAELLRAALHFYVSQIHFQRAETPTEPLTIQKHLAAYEAFWDDFRMKMNRCSALLDDIADVRAYFKEAYMQICNSVYDQVFALILAAIYVKILNAQDPSYLTLKKTFEMVYAGGDVVQGNLADYLADGFRDMMRKSFQAFEHEETSFYNGVASAMRQISEICQIVTYLSYDQAMCSFKFVKNDEFELVMDGTKGQISLSRNSCKMICGLLLEAYRLIFGDRKINKTFYQQFAKMPAGEKTRLFRNLTLLAKYCDFYMELAGNESEEERTMDRLQAEICQLYFNYLSACVDAAKSITTSAIVASARTYGDQQDVSRFMAADFPYLSAQGTDSIPNQPMFNCVYLIVLTDEFYHSLAANFPSKISLETDLMHTLQNFLTSSHGERHSELQDAVFAAADHIQYCRSLYNITRYEHVSNASFSEFRFYPSLQLFQAMDRYFRRVMHAVFCCCGGDQLSILTRLVHCAFIRIYIFASAAVPAESALSILIRERVGEPIFAEYYQYYVDSFALLLENPQKTVIVDQEALQILGFSTLKQQKQLMRTNSFMVTHATMNGVMLVLCGEDEGLANDNFAGCDAYLRLPVYSDAQPEGEPVPGVNDTPTYQEYAPEQRQRPPKILYAMIARICKIQGKMSINELARTLAYPEELVHEAVEALVELDVISCADDGGYVFEE